MSRFLRWTFNSATAVSALLCAGAAFLWVRSYSTLERFHLRTLPVFGITNTCGEMSVWEVELNNEERTSSSMEAWRLQRYSFDKPATPLHQTRFLPGFALLGAHPGAAKWTFAIRHGVVVTLSLILPLYRGIAMIRRRKRTIPGFCSCCGYDLRASTDRCPECGTPIPVRTPAPL